MSPFADSLTDRPFFSHTFQKHCECLQCQQHWLHRGLKGALLQVGSEAEPRRRRYGLIQGLTKRNKSESEASPHASTGFRLRAAKPPGFLQPEAIAESENDDDDDSGHDVFASPRCGTRCVAV